MTLQPEIARIEAASTRQVWVEGRVPRPADLRAARREMRAFASYLLASW
ncbi:hypothetical protein [Pseudonocardia kunmingensis]|nr:hypothetical protein [Pseudonocardia kunmingensis]